MKMNMYHGNRLIWFWERIISPHNSWFLIALAKLGCRVVYVTETGLTQDRLAQGWSLPPLEGLSHLKILSQADVEHFVSEAPIDSIHICGGIRRNGLIGYAQRKLKKRGLCQWLVMETVKDDGLRGVLKRMEYARLFITWKNSLQGVLAIGAATPSWVSARGMPAHKIFPFAYFLRHQGLSHYDNFHHQQLFRFLFVGQFIELKRLDHLIDALKVLNRSDFELAVVGSGLLENQLCVHAERCLPGRVRWIGKLPIESVQKEMANADCLVLPSRHDGWGAVVSESLMVGTPVICSDRCGSSIAVKASGYGAVFPAGSRYELATQLGKMLDKGPLSTEERASLAKWARCLGAEAGAKYLLQIFAHSVNCARRPYPPWDKTKLSEVKDQIIAFKTNETKIQPRET